jgi:uncharacterized phiE125 gp8 family phage protein
MDLFLTTAPNEEPVTLAEAKTHLRVDGAAEDALIGALISAARQSVEARTNRALCTQVWEARFDAFPADDAFVELPRSPLQSVQQVSYLDATGTLVQATIGDFDVLAPSGPHAQPGSVGPKPDKTWPTNVQDRAHAARIRFVAGYGAASAVPAPLKAALLLILGDLYANREAQIVGGNVAENRAVDALLAPFRVFYA